MKRLYTIVCLAIASVLYVGAQAQDLSSYKTIDYKVRDLALIYQGGGHRIGWTTKEIEPYVTHVFEDGREDWIFDGFLFLEFTSNAYGGRQFTPGYGQPNALKSDWEEHLKRLFKKNRALDALNTVIGEKKKTLGDPGFKHKICLTLFVPIQGQTDWGELDGQAMDFNKAADRVAVGQWFVNELATRFAAENYENLELYGIYMIAEDTWGVETFTRRMGPYINSLGLDFVWIPYFKARGADIWKSQKFNIAYMQPNHFFDVNVPDSRLDEAITYAKQYGLQIEYECDENALSQKVNNKLARMEAYTSAFERHGIWYDTPVAYYTGNHMFLDMQRSPSPENNAAIDRLCQFIVNRKNKFLQDSAVDEIQLEDAAPVYYNLQGVRVENPASGIFIEKRGEKTRKVVF